MIQRFVLLLALGLSLYVADWAQAAPYDYPVTSPYAATVVGTPQPYKAELPKKIPVKDFALTVFPDRDIPDVLWYSKALRYSLVAQNRPAPLIFVIAGTGAGYREAKMQVLQRALYQAGLHVLSLSSPTHPNFIVSASTTGIPGHLLEDSQDLYRVMELAWQQVQDRVKVTEFYVTGYSLGGAQAAVVSKLDEEQGVFGFRKVLLINPPVSLFNSTAILDEMLAENLPGGPDNVQAFFDRVFRAFSEVYRTGDFVPLTGDFLYAAYQERQPPDEVLAALIGLSFRLSSANLVFTSDVLTNAGYIKPKNLTLSTTDSVTDYFKVANRVTFHDYFEQLFAPFFQARYPGITEQDLIKTLSLTSLEEYLRGANKIGLVHNEDDIILAPGELEYLLKIFGTRAKIYPRGGHCGNFEHRENVAYLMEFFQERRPMPFQPQPNETAQQSVRIVAVSTIQSQGSASGQIPAQEIGGGQDVHFQIERLEREIRELRNRLKRLDHRIAQDSSNYQSANLLARSPAEQEPEGERVLPAKRPVSAIVKADVEYPIDVYDPLERFNRGVYKFNALFDEYVFLPAVYGYEAIMPDYLEDRVSDVFSNLEEIRNLLNALLQLKFERSLKITTRFLINTTFGWGGLWDHATDMGIPQHVEDFGQTLGHYGLGAGPYLILPIFGPSNLRDGTGLVVDSAARYFYLYVPLEFDDHGERGTAYTLVNAVDTRHRLDFRYYQTGSPFEYDLVRLLYTTVRRLEIDK